MNGLVLLLLLLIGFCSGYYFRRKQVLSDAHAARCYADRLIRQIEALKGESVSQRRQLATSQSELDTQLQQNAALRREIAALCDEIVRWQNAGARLQAKAASRKLHSEQNDVSNPENQIRFIGQVGLRAVQPVNKEAVCVLYALEEWMKANRSGWRLSFEVCLGAFIKTKPGHDELKLQQAFSSYNSKRVDFLLIDNYGAPMLAVEYHGTGHHLSDDAGARMQVKRLALARAGIPLLEIPARTSKQEIQKMISASLAASASPVSAP